MGLDNINKALIKMSELKYPFSDKAKDEILYHAYKTDDMTSTINMINDVVKTNNDSELEMVISKYNGPETVRQSELRKIENIVVTMETYRIEQEKFLNDLNSMYEKNLKVKKSREHKLEYIACTYY